MTLTDLWTAMATGDRRALESAYIHRVMRERGPNLVKGRADVGADWMAMLASGDRCEVIADLGDMAVIKIGACHHHHWVRREAGRIAFEVLIRASGASRQGAPAIVERRIVAGDQGAELFHLFGKNQIGEPVRRIGSRVSKSGLEAIGEETVNG